MELRDITLDDLSLYENLHCDPQMMAHLGGPWPTEGIPAKLQRDVESVEKGESWVFKIIPDADAGVVAGSVCLWESSRNGETITEVGWMVLPRFQGRGLGTQAVSMIIDKARDVQRCDTVHAFPAVSNVASNAICRKLGFSLIKECDLEYAGTLLRCNHWRLGLRVGVAR
jgi:RimJ/RimL family protein N-acetyltransferase